MQRTLSQAGEGFQQKQVMRGQTHRQREGVYFSAACGARRRRAANHAANPVRRAANPKFDFFYDFCRSYDFVKKHEL